MISNTLSTWYQNSPGMYIYIYIYLYPLTCGKQVQCRSDPFDQQTETQRSV